MNLKEKLQNLRNNLLEEKEEKYISKKDVLLEKKIEEFLTWYENDFLDQYPNAEKIANGYIIYENETKITYIFKDGILENIITVEN